MAQDDDLLASRLVLLGAEYAPPGRRDAEDVEVRGGDPVADRPLRPLPFGEIEAEVLRRAHAGEGALALRQDGVVAGRGDRVLAAEDHEPLRLRQGQRPENDGVDDAEDRRGRAEPQGEREHGDEAERRVGGELAHGEPGVLAKLGEVLAAAHVLVPLPADLAAGRPHGLQIAEAAEGGSARRGRVHAARNVFTGPHLEMELELLAHLVVDVLLPEPAHGGPLRQAGRRTFETAEAKRAHCSVSDLSCWRPWGVSL